MLKRKILKDLYNWKEHSANKALLVTGARQVGKTYIIRYFAKKNWDNFVEINFIENDDAKQAFGTAKNSKELFFRLSTFADTSLVPGKTVIFLDEVQVVKEFVTVIKFLCENSQYDYILSGSMLGVELKNISSAPVGFLNTLIMYPLDFEEFCWANGVNTEVIQEAKEAFNNRRSIDEFAHKRFTDLLQKYIICGGMPDAVSAYIETNNFADVRNSQETIAVQYKADISKYAGSRGLVIKRIFDLMPSEISQQNKKFIVKDIEGDSHLSRYENDFLWLADANVALPTYNVKEPRYPLLTSLDVRSFKLYLSDVGLLTYLCGMDIVRDIFADRPDINFGAIYENFVAQELNTHHNRLLYYKNRRLGEVDFLIQKKNQVIPIEVKSGKTYKRHSALNNLLNVKNYFINESFVLYNGNVNYDNTVLYLPVYMAMFI